MNFTSSLTLPPAKDGGSRTWRNRIIGAPPVRTMSAQEAKAFKQACREEALWAALEAAAAQQAACKAAN